jgi:hypothetical protein
VLRKDLPAPRVDLHLTGDRHAGAFQAKVEAADAGEQGQDVHYSHLWRMIHAQRRARGPGCQGGLWPGGHTAVTPVASRTLPRLTATGGRSPLIPQLSVIPGGGVRQPGPSAGVPGGAIIQ